MIDLLWLSQVLNARVLSNNLKGFKSIAINDIDALTDEHKEFLKLIGDDRILYSYIKSASLYDVMRNYIKENKNKLTYVNWSADNVGY